MGFVKLELRCSKSSPVVSSPDPEPLWTVDDLFAEIAALERQLGGKQACTPLPLKQPERSDEEEAQSKPFVMSVDDFDAESESESEEEEGLALGARFSGDEEVLSNSDIDGGGSTMEANQLCLLEKTNLEESLFLEFEAEHQMKLKEEVRNKLAELETSQKYEVERSASATARIEKLMEAQQEMDRRLDRQYQRKMAEVLDNHLSAVQRDHEQKSQIEERRLRDDAEEEKREALLKEKQQQEKAKVEAEARIKAAKLAEDAQRAAFEASEKARREAAAIEAEKTKAKNTGSTLDVVKDGAQQQKSSASGDENAVLTLPKDAHQTGVRVLAANVALEDEARRLKLYNVVAEKTNLVPEKEFNRLGRRIYKFISQISGTIQNVSEKSMELVALVNDPTYPHSISKLLFAKKVVALCEDPTAMFKHFACAHVILLVNSKIPDVMDLVLAELNKACIYTVPKYLQTSEQTTQSEDYWKMVGYREENGKIESTDTYLVRVQSYMRLYAAIVQTEINVQNPHGLNKGWSWLARFLNTLPATRPTAYALVAFLEVAGFAMHRRYKSQFKKILNVISQRFLPALKARADPKTNVIILTLQEYLSDRIFLNEPVGWRLQSRGLVSDQFDHNAY